MGVSLTYYTFLIAFVLHMILHPSFLEDEGSEIGEVEEKEKDTERKHREGEEEERGRGFLGRGKGNISG